MLERTGVLAAAALLALGCRPGTAGDDRDGGEPTFRSCDDAGTREVLADSRCARVSVPLRYGGPRTGAGGDPAGDGSGSRDTVSRGTKAASSQQAGPDSIEIFVRKFPAEDESRGTIWMLAGGPQSGAMFYPFMETVRRAFPGMDVVIPDQRGTGFSARICPDQEAVNSPGGSRLSGREWPACYEHMREHADYVRAFSVTHAARDAGELMARLGGDGPRYLFGTSFGSLVVLRFLQAEVAPVDGVILGSTMPLVTDSVWGETRKAQMTDAVGHQLLARCDADAGCRELLGGDALGRYESVLRRVEVGDLELPDALPDGDLKTFMGRLLDFPDARGWIPGLVASLAAGDTVPLAAAVRRIRGRGPVVDFPGAPLSVPMANTVLTSERVLRPDLTADRLDREKERLDFADRLPYQIAAGLEADLPVYETGPHHGTIPDTVPPTLILNGTLDVRTPHDGARRLARALRAAGEVGLVSVRDAPHYLVAHAPECFVRHVREFVSGGEPRDAWCGEDAARLDFDEELPDPRSVSGRAVPTGDWSGDIDFPGRPDTAWGATWHVARSDTSPGLELSFSNPTTRGVGPVRLETDGDTLRFPLPFDRSTACEAVRREDGRWRGSCPAPGGDGSYDVLLAPPGLDPPVGAARMGLERVEGDWRATRAGRVVVHTRPGTEARRHLDAVTRHARASVERAVELLGADAREGPVRLVYLESPEEMERAVGRPVRGGWADAGANAALLVTYDGGATGVLHEVIHVVSMGRWGAAARPGMWLQEGLAEWGAGGDCGSVPHGRLDRFLHDRGDGLSVGELTGGFRRHSDRITMPQATTLVGYLMDVHGLEAVRGLWDRGIGKSRDVLGYGTGGLQRRWRDWVEERWEPATEAEWNATIGSEQGCPREQPGGPDAASEARHGAE